MIPECSGKEIEEMEEKNRFKEVEDQVVVLITPSYWEQFKKWQKPYQVLLLSILTVIVIGIIAAICFSLVVSDGKPCFRFYSLKIF